MNTKFAIVCLMAFSLDASPSWPDWIQAIAALAKVGGTAYLVWYAWRGPDPVEIRTKKGAP